MLYYHSESTDPYRNLAVEEHLFTTLPRHTSCLYLWQNDNTIVIGKYQNTVEEINQNYVDKNHIRVARRMSGGGAVYHDLGNLNYTIITDADATLSGEYTFFMEPVLRALHRLHIPARSTGRNDIMVNGRKISGCAQYSSGDRILCHGCIMLDTDTSRLAEALNVNKLKIDSYSTKSVSSHVATINQIAASPISMEHFKKILEKEFLQGNTSSIYTPSKEELYAIDRLQHEKYETWNWNYGYYSDYRIQKERKYPYGLVKIHMNVEKACIRDILFSGDFFGNGNIEVFQNSLKGLRLDDEFENALEHLDISYYIHGMTSQDLNTLIKY